MKIPKEARRFAREFYRASLGEDGHLDPARVRNYSDRLVAEKPRHFIPILKEYSRLIRLELNRRHAIVESASTLDSAESSRISNDIRTRFGSDLTIETKVNPALVGGLRIQVGSDVWDGSIRAKLDSLKQKL